MSTVKKIHKRLKYLDHAETGYEVMGTIHRVLITVPGLIILGASLASITFVSSPLDGEFRPELIYLVFLILYVVCDLVRLRFQHRATISLGFPIVFLTLAVNGSPLAALLVATLGSWISEVLWSRFLSKRRLLPLALFCRATFYASHHAIAALAALEVYQRLRGSSSAWFDLKAFHVQATLAYVIVYALLSMLLVYPHDRRVRLFLVRDEAPFVRVDVFMTSMLLPFPALVLYLYDQPLDPTVKALVVLGVLPPLFILLFFLSRYFARVEEEQERLALWEQIRQHLGSPANMAEMVEGVLKIGEQLIPYRWGAVYSLLEGEFVLCGHRSDQETKILYASGEFIETEKPDQTASLHGNQVVWPERFPPDQGKLVEFAQASSWPRFFDNGLVPSEPSDPHLPKRAALVVLPIVAGKAGTQELTTETKNWVGLVALARPKRLFTTWDWERGQALCSQAGNLMLGVQRLEEKLREIYQKVEDYVRDPEKMRQAMTELEKRGIDVSKILAVLSNRSFHDNLRAVLRGVIEGRRGNSILLTSKTLTDIYNRVRDETPGMHPIDAHILQLLETFTSSLSFSFSFSYQFPDVARGPVFKTLYEFLSVAMDANTVSRIVALDADIGSAVQAIQRDETPQDTDSLPAEVVEEIRGLQNTVDQLQAYSEEKDAALQRTPLNRALDLLLECEASAREKLRDPERFIFLQILSGWRGAITRELEKLESGPARLELRLRNQQALPLEEVTVGLMLKNLGPGIASNVVVQLEPSPNYQALESLEHLGTLVAGKTVEPEFTLRPQGEGPLRLQFQITYHDPERKGKRDEFADLFHLRKPPSDFKDVPNPYTPGLPLRPGSATFVGRDDIFDFIRRSIPALTQKMILVLVGERRTGKTSILQQLTERLKDPRYIPIYLDGQALGIDLGIGNFFLSLATAITDALEDAGISSPRLTLKDLGESPRHVFENDFLPAIRERVGERVLLLTIDEFEELADRVNRDRLPPDLFPYLRHLIQHSEQLAFIFAGTHRIEALIGEYWSVLFNLAVYRNVGFLKREEASSLIKEPVRPFEMVYDDLAVDEMLRLTANHPYFIQLLCNILVNRCNEAHRSYVTIQDVRDSVEELLETGRAHLQFIWYTSNLEARLALATLADLRERLDQVTAATMANHLGSYQIRRDPGSIIGTLEQLATREIVREMPGNPPSYDFTAQLYTSWIRRYQPLSKVVEEVNLERVAV